MTLNLAPEEEMAAFLKGVRTHTPEEDRVIALRHAKYDLTPDEWIDTHSHIHHASAA